MAESTDFTTLPLSCRCGQIKVTVDVPTPSLPLPLILCHCNTCTKVTGQLCATVVAVPANSKPLSIQGKPKGYRTSGALERFFCPTCGTSIYEDASGMSPGLIFLDTGAFSTGTITTNTTGPTPIFTLSEHIFVSDAKDGGLRDWTPHVPAWEGWMGKSPAIPSGQYYASQTQPEPSSRFVSSKDTLSCACKCAGVSFTVTRPKDGSKHWPAPAESELASSPVAIPKSPEWWMPAAGAKYNAYLCACNDCRLSSGYEVSAWAIIPKKNFAVPSQSSTTNGTANGTGTEVSPDNVEGLQRASTMRDWAGEGGTHRQFCGECGATLSMFRESAPNLMHVAVGVMQGKTGPRCEEWLEWQVEEVGYEGLAQNKGFVGALAEGMREWSEKHPVGGGGDGERRF